jgi:hypothetical protein
MEQFAWANVILVWSVPFLAGIAFADDRAAGKRFDPRRFALWGVLAVAVAALIVLVLAGPYPPSMIGMPGDTISNLGPPTAPVVAHALAQVSAVLLARAALVRWASGPARGAMAFLTRNSMSVYLWHLTAMFVVIGGVLVALGGRLPTPWSAEWWVTRPLWFAMFAAVLAVLVSVFGRLEKRRPVGATSVSLQWAHDRSSPMLSAWPPALRQVKRR